ncbi:MAG: ATP-binding cassette domain-containing protein [Fibrobacter sp.]|jgi:oligopeptide/dipeptide ABC transporter ATP-binding protein|nr:ATP-binding cassette domain-containing protein [Fibrobacter sp.]
MTPPVLEVENMTVWYPLRGGLFSRVERYVKAVRSLSFSLSRGEVLGIVGESGCGKSTAAGALVGLSPWRSGSYRIIGNPVHTDNASDWKKVCDKVQMVFQDPFSSLNPRQTVLEILTYPLKSRGISAREASQKAEAMLSRVGLAPELLSRFPHAFSGGQRQRIAIARALITNPEVLVCDEVTSALDVSIQAQVLNLLDELRRDMGISIIFISHDMQVVKAFADRVLVMYLGEMMEYGAAEQVFSNPQHPYTQALLKSIPTLDKTHPPKILAGISEMPADDFCGCSFAPRCSQREARCTEAPVSIRGASVQVRCVKALL